MADDLHNEDDIDMQPTTEDGLETVLEKEMENMMQDNSEDDIEKALEKEMDKLHPATEDDIEKALEKEMDKMHPATEDDIEKALEKEMDKLHPSTEDGIEKALEKEMDKLHPATEDDIEKALEKEMDKTHPATQDDIGTASATQLETVRPTEEDDLESALDRELDGMPPNRESQVDAKKAPDAEEKDDLVKELEKAMDALSDVDEDIQKDLEMELEKAEAEGDLRTPSKEAKEKPSPKSSKKSPQKDNFVDESRFILDKDGVRLHKWKVDYASRGGGGRAMCRDKDCLERMEQAGVASIEKGALRIGHRIVPWKDGEPGDVWILWYHARCIFNTQSRARKTTRTIQSIEDLEGFEEIRAEDQDLLKRLIAGSEDLRKVRFRDGGGDSEPSRKRGIEEPAAVAAKRRREEEKTKKQIELKKGNRCWTYVHTRGEDRDGLIRAVRSDKPELGLIVGEEQDGCLRIQFESKEHETERLEMQRKQRYKKLSGWLRYPRVFEGAIQKINEKWVFKTRPPPRLCSCKLQEWGHECPCSGITCSRGTTQKIWGVGQ